MMRADSSVWFAASMALLASACVDADRDAPLRAEPNREVHNDTPAHGSRRDANGIWLEQQKLLAMDGANSEYFGAAVAMSADTVLVGSYGDDDVGSVQAFERSAGTWGSPVKLLVSGGADGDLFGVAVAVSVDGDTVLIGASGDSTHGPQAGAAYIFVRSGGTWSQQAELHPDDPAQNANFGNAVSLAGDTALVGASGDAAAGTKSGSAYVFVRSAGSWTQQTKLLPKDGGEGHRFGGSVAVSADTALIGADASASPSDDPGSAYIFMRSGTQWSEHQQLTPSEVLPQLGFGHSVAIAGDTALVGVPGDADLGVRAGATYVYTRSGSVWTQQQKLLAADGSAGTGLGSKVCLSGDWALIAAEADSAQGAGAGSAYLFLRSADTWSEQQKLLSSDGVENDQLGVAAALMGETALLGAWGDDDLGSYSGSAYLFTRNGQPCVQDADCASRYCVDGLCCVEACGGGQPGDCQGCAAALTEGQDGRCDLLPNGLACDDGSFCNGTETCLEGVCAGATGNPCSEHVSDGDDDCSEACDEVADACSGADPNGTVCEGGKRCYGGACLELPGAPCSAGEACSTGYCVNEVCCAAESCGAYRCGPDGICGDSCSSAADCAAGHECAASGRCEAIGGDAGKEDGCGCGLVGAEPERSWSAWLLLLAARSWRKRHQRGGQP